MEDSAELCGIAGEHHEPITKEEFNRLVSQVKFYHYRPQQQAIARIEEMMKNYNATLIMHIDEDKAFHNKLLGAKWALWAIAGILSFLAPLVWQLIQALKLVGVL